LPDFDLSSASAGAAQSLSQPADQQTAVTPSQPEGQVAPTTPETPTNEPAGQQKFLVKENGKDVEVTLDELLSGHLRHRDYTKKTMEVAEHRKQLEALQTATQQRETQMNEFLRDAQQVAAYYQYLTGQQLSSGQVQQIASQSGDPATAIQQMRSELQSEMQKVQQMTQQELNKFQETQRAARAADFERDISGTLKGLLENPEFESLHDIGDPDEISDFICQKAMQMGPRNIDEAKQAILDVAKAKLEHLSTRRKEMLKKTEAQKVSLSKQGIEPPGGTGVKPTPTNFKLGDKGLTEAAIAHVESLRKK
jgi:hypothetical protein